MSCHHSHETLYARVFATLYDPVLSVAEKGFLYERRESLLSKLNGRVLDVGAGTGLNFEHFPGGADVIAVEPSHAMLDYARRRIETGSIRARIEIRETGIEDPSLSSVIREGSLDYAVCSLVLCTIPDPVAALGRIRNWLRPEGRLIVIEHIRSRSPITGTVQDLINPAWKPFAEGCHLNRPSDRFIREAGFRTEYEKYYSFVMPIYEGVFAPGITSG